MDKEKEKDILIKEVYPIMNTDNLCIHIKTENEMELYVEINEIGTMTIKCFWQDFFIRKKNGHNSQRNDRLSNILDQ